MRSLRDKLSSKLNTARSRSSTPSATSHPLGPVSRQADDHSTPHVSNDLPERLWNQAYDELKSSKADSAIVEAYEKILSNQLQEATESRGNDADPPNVIETDPNKRWKQMEQLVQIGLQRTEKDANRKAKVHRGLDIIQPVRKAIDTGIKAAPEAALAWAGVSCVLEILSSPLLEPGKNRDGIAYVVSRMEWYWEMSTLLLDENRANESSHPLRAQLEKHIINLYQRLLLYEMKSVYLYHRSRSMVFFRDLPKLDDWDAQLKDIKDAEEAVMEDTAQYNTLEVRTQLKNMSLSAAAQEGTLRGILSATKQQDEWQRWARQDDKEKECLRDLHDTDPRDDKKRIEDTKGGLIWDSYSWILKHPDYHRWLSDQDSRLLWIKGDPGKGKTMLLCGLINELEESTPGSISYFFCQATLDRLRSATAVVRGLIYSLVRQRPALILHVRKRYDEAGKEIFNNHNTWQALCDIFTKILGDAESHGCIFVVDALDECTTDREQLIDLICHLSVSSKAKWIVSSRNWPEIEEKLETATRKVRLHLELNHTAVSDAVHKYITYKVSELSREKNYDESTRTAVQKHLVANANNTFLWVALVCRSLKKSRPHQTLRVLESFPAGLDELYQRMIDGILDTIDAEICKAILAIVVVAFRPLTLAELAVANDALSEYIMKPEVLREIVNSCGSFLTIREGVVYLVHQSAKDFLLEKAVNEIMPWGVAQQHYFILSSALSAMQERLHRNPYDLHDQHIAFDGIRTPRPNALACIRYSCIYWVDHLHESKASWTEDQGAAVVASVTKFLEEGYLYWMEVMSVLRHVSEAIKAIRKLGADLQRIAPQGIANLLQDALRFILSNRSIMDTFPLQLYDSGLIFSPSHSRIRRLFWREAPDSVEIISSSFQNWDTCLQTIQGVTASRASLHFAPDGQRLATVDASPSTILIVDASTGECLKSLEGHQNWVHSVDFHPDGQHLASASGDQSVMIWNTSNGECIQSLQGHLKEVTRAVFSPDGQLLASASHDGTIKIWNPWTGSCIRTLSLDKFSSWLDWGSSAEHPRCLLSISRGITHIGVWDAMTGEQLQKVAIPGYVTEGIMRSTALAPDGRHLAVATFDRIWICNWQTSRTLHTIDDDVLSSGVSDLAWSPDGHAMAIATSNDIVVWNFQKGAISTRLPGHTGRVRSVCYGKGSQLASTATDNTLKIWNVISDPEQPVSAPDETRRTIVELILGPNGQLATRAMNGDIQIVNVATGEAVHTFQNHHSRKVWSMAFGPAHHLAAVSRDGILLIWDTVSGACLHRFQVCDDLREGDSVYPKIAFGVSGRLASVAKEIKIWNISTGACLQTFGKSINQLPALAFSMDGRISCTMKDDDIQIWDAQSGRLERTIKVNTKRLIMSLAFGSKCLLAGSTFNGVIYVWDLSHGACIQRVSLGSVLLGLAFDPASDSRLSTGAGVLRLDLKQKHTEHNSEPVAPLWDPQCVRMFYTDTEAWFMRGSEKVLWIPPDAMNKRGPRPVADVAIDSSLVALAHGSHVLVLRFR